MRIRTVKPDFFLDEDLDRLDERIQKLFIGLLCLADCEGRLGDSPVRIRAQVFPYKPDYDVDAMLQALHEGCFIDRYEVEGIRCISIRNFRKHQRPHPKEPALGLPAPPAEGKSREKKFLAVKRHVESPQQAGGKGREGKGALTMKEGKGREPPLAGDERPPPDPRHAPLVKSLTDEAHKHDPGWGFTRRAARDVTALLELGEPDEVLRRWARAWATETFPRVRQLHELVTHWGHFGGATVIGFASDLRGKAPIRAEDQAHLHGPEGEVAF